MRVVHPPLQMQCLTSSSSPKGVKAPITLKELPRGTMKEVEIQPARTILLVHVCITRRGAYQKHSVRSSGVIYCRQLKGVCLRPVPNARKHNHIPGIIPVPRSMQQLVCLPAGTIMRPSLRVCSTASVSCARGMALVLMQPLETSRTAPF
jgi:hypothetical protein